jgi:hypothetical protein
VQVLFEKPRRGFAKKVLAPDSVQLLLPDLIYTPGEYQFGFFKVACSSAFANLMAEDLFLDMPDPAAVAKPRTSFASHVSSPFGSEAGRPLRDL